MAFCQHRELSLPGEKKKKDFLKLKVASYRPPTMDGLDDILDFLSKEPLLVLIGWQPRWLLEKKTSL